MRLGRHKSSSPPPDRQLLRWASWVIGLALTFSVACAGRSASPGEPVANQAPTWTYRKPDNPDLLLGLGRAPFAGDRKRARETALALARDDLLKSVKVTTRRWVHQRSDLPDPQLIDATWEHTLWDRQEEVLAQLATEAWYEEADRGRIWVLLTVDRATFEEELGRFADRIPKAIEGSLGKADAARRKQNLPQEIAAVGAALVIVAGPEGLTVASPRDPHRLLRQDVEDRLRAALGGVRVVPESPPSSLPPGTVDVALVARAEDPSGGALSIPLQFAFSQGEGVLGDASGPDNKGRSTAHLVGVGPRDPRIVIRVSPDLARMVDGSDVEGRLIERATAAWDLPYADLEIEVIPIRLLLTYIERGGAGGQRGALLVDELGAAFTAAGAELVVPNMQTLLKAELFETLARGAAVPQSVSFPDVDLIGVAMVELSAHTTQGRAPEMHAASGTGSFRLYDPAEQRYLLEVSTGPLSFSGFSQTDAERGFFFQASDRLRDRVIEEIRSRDVLN